MSERWEIEGWAPFFYELAGLDPAHPKGPVALARGLLGRRSVRVVPGSALPRDALLTQTAQLSIAPDIPGASPYEIRLRHGLCVERKVWGVSHEIGEWANLEYIHYTGPDVEPYVNALGASFIAPRPSFLRMLRDHGPDFAQLARIFCATETCMVRRYSEVTGAPLLFVTPNKVLRFGDFVWPEDDGEARFLAKAERLPAMFSRCELTDARKRIALFVA